MERRKCRSCKVLKTINEFPPKPRITKTKKGEYIYWTCRNCVRINQRTCKLKKVGLTIDQYESMAASQDFACAICGIKPKKLQVDHDHETNKARGLLCRSCNFMLGNAKENGIILQRAIEYLDQHDSNSKVSFDDNYP